MEGIFKHAGSFFISSSFFTFSVSIHRSSPAAFPSCSFCTFSYSCRASFPPSFPVPHGPTSTACSSRSPFLFLLVCVHILSACSSFSPSLFLPHILRLLLPDLPSLPISSFFVVRDPQWQSCVASCPFPSPRLQILADYLLPASFLFLLYTCMSRLLFIYFFSFCPPSSPFFLSFFQSPTPSISVVIHINLLSSTSTYLLSPPFYHVPFLLFLPFSSLLS